MTLALVLKYWKAGVVALALIVALTAWHQRDNALVARGKAIEQARVADSTLKAVKPQLARTDTLVVHDTVKVRYAISRLDTLRDTLLTHLTDTVLVKEYVTRADSVAKACTELSNDCAAFRAYASQTIAALQAKVKAQPATIKVRCTESNVVSGIIGAAGGYLLGLRTR